MSSDELFNALEAVSDEPSLLHFVGLLFNDRSASDRTDMEPDGHQGEWANHTVASFLFAAKRWADDSSFGARPGPKPSNPWQLFARFLWAGRGYE